ncbi:hypothetical protein MNBD_CHLOROFLEXI01-1314 [hydrothermal vent metagenome]|uniref:Uncharacterized protein n=1 Tax=hydrothermal vent metagenome TaxID=652676 RepID=A0A3B0USR0_9ZZZZ
MNVKRTILISIIFILGLFVLAACGGKTAEPEVAPEVANVEATVNAAVMATANAEAALETVINTAVDEAVTVALDAAVEEEVAAALAAATPEATYAVYTEEELILLIEETTQEAESSTASYTEATTAATSDDVITTEEAQTIEYYVTISEETLAEVDAMIETYYALYGGTGDEVVAELVAIESELDELNDDVAEMVVILDEINSTLAAGYELAEETIVQLEQAAVEAQVAIDETAVQMQAWAINAQTTAQTSASTIQDNIAASQEDLSSILQESVPTDIADSYEAAMEQVVSYISVTSTALADSSISPQEMEAIAQTGTNAAASLTAQGKAGSNLLINNIDSLNQQLASGDIQGAMIGLNNLQGQLPDLSTLSINIPSGGNISLPSGNLPSPGSRP